MPAYFLPLGACPDSHLNQSQRDLRKLIQSGLPVIPQVIIPSTTLQEIADANGLASQVLQLNSLGTSEAFRERELSIFKTRMLKQAIPSKIVRELFLLYYSLFHEALCQVSARGVSITPRVIFGEASLSQEILRVWAESVGARLTSIQRNPLEIAQEILTIQRVADSPIRITGYTFNHLQHDSKTLTFEVWRETGSHIGLRGLSSRTDGFSAPPQKNVQTYCIDIRTQLVVSRQLSGSAPILQGEQLERLAHILIVAKRQFFEPKQLQVGLLSSDTIVIEAIRQMQRSVAREKKSPSTSQTSPKHTRSIWIQASNPSRGTQWIADGVVFHSTYSFAAFGVHPESALKTTQKKQILAKQVSKNLERYVDSYPTKPLLYRPYDFSTTQAQELLYAPSTFHSDHNPSFFNRGAWYYLHHPAALDFQLAIIQQVARVRQKSIGFVVPWVRSLVEFQKITSFGKHTGIPFWIEVASSEILLSPRQLLATNPRGCIIDLQLLLATMTGADPTDFQQIELYREQTRSVRQLIATATRVLSESGIPTLIKLSKDDLSLIDHSQTSAVGFVVPATQAQVFHQILAQMDQNSITQSSNHGST